MKTMSPRARRAISGTLHNLAWLLPACATVALAAAPAAAQAAPGEIGRQDVVRVGRPGHQVVVLHQGRLPLVDVATHEPAEIVEAIAAGPMVEGAV